MSPIDGDNRLEMSPPCGRLTLEPGAGTSSLSSTAPMRARAHPRSAVGLAELPFGMPVEIVAEVAIRA